MHTGYIPPKVLRLRKREIDGACNDKRYPDDFFIDLVFDECSADVASKILVTSSSNSTGKDVSKQSNDVKESKNNTSLTASAYDSMLHRDSRFWDVIAKRRSEISKLYSSQGKDEEKSSSFYGPLVGRRREFANEKVSMESKDKISTNQATYQSGIHSFTIGEELDFTTEKDSHVSQNAGNQGSQVGESSIKNKKDDLMEALMALDDDEEEQDEDFEEQIHVQSNPHDASDHLGGEVEEIVFAGEFDVFDEHENKSLLSGEEEKKLVGHLQDAADQNDDDFVVEEDDIDDSELQDLEDFLLKVTI